MKKLEDLKQDLANLKVQKIAGGAASKLTKMFVKNNLNIYTHVSLINQLITLIDTPILASITVEKFVNLLQE